MAKQEDIPDLERGTDLSRIAAFTDGVFAIAITLIVLQLDVPDRITTDPELWQQVFRNEGVDFVAFLISFAVIGRYWVLNHQLMRMVGAFDHRMLGLLLLYLLFIVLIPFSSELLGEHGDLKLSLVVYIVNLVLVNFSTTLLMVHIRKADLEKPGFPDVLDSWIKASWFVTAVFALTIPLALFIGSWALFLWIPAIKLNPWERRMNAQQKAARE
ncbi:MAG: TMEM175 family protein [Solirubrobacterales bacterium]